MITRFVTGLMVSTVTPVVAVLMIIVFFLLGGYKAVGDWQGTGLYPLFVILVLTIANVLAAVWAAGISIMVRALLTILKEQNEQ